MIKNIAIIFFILFSKLIADEFIVKDIYFKGNTKFSHSDLIKQIQTKLNSPLDHDVLRIDQQRIVQFYEQNNYFFTKISKVDKIPVDHQSVDLIFYIEEQKNYQIDHIIISNSRYFSSKKINELISHSKFNVTEIDQIKDNILDLYLSRAFLFAQIRLDSLSVKQDSLTAYFYVDEGKQCNFNHSLIRGNKVSKPESIIKIARLKKSQLITHQTIKEAELRLNDKDYIDHCSVSPINSETLLFDIKEGKMSRIEGIFGYNNQNKASINGFVNLDFMNLFGYDRHFNFSWQSLQNKQKLVKMLYEDPGFVYFPINFNLSFSRKEVDSTYIQISFKSEVFKEISKNNIGLSFGLSEVNPGSRRLNVINQSQQKKIGLLWKYHDFDYPKNPKEGFAISYNYTFSAVNKNSGLQEEHIKRNENELQIQHAIPLKKKLVWYNSLTSKFMQNKSLEFYDLYSIGGSTNLRGFTEDFFLGNNVVYLNSELRMITSKDSRFFIFFDYGIIQDQRKEVDLLISDALSFGAGIRYPTRLGIVMMDYALHYYEKKFLHPMDAFIHLGIQTDF